MRLEFPEVSEPDVVFGGYPEEWFQEVLKKLESREYSNLAQSLFFEGGKIPFNKELPEEYLIKGSRILRAILGSFKPKHEHKIHVAGLILESLCAHNE